MGKKKGNQFNNLSDDNDADLAAVLAATAVPEVNEHARQASGFVGILNQGATCYMNSLLQTLYMTPSFRHALYQLTAEDLGHKLKPKDESKHEKEKKERKIPIQLQYLFGDMQLANVLAVSTRNLTDSFGWTNGEVAYQQDVSELNRQLLDAIEQSLKGTKGDKLVDSLYKGTLVQEIKCKQCGLESQRPESFIDLQVMVEGLSSLVESLDQFISVETLTNDNQYMCELCGKKVDAEKRFKIDRVPPVLTFTLTRFKFNPKKKEREKLQTPFAFPMELDMTSYITSEALKASNGNVQYDLLSVLIHHGQAHGGHYYAYIRDTLNEGCWDLNEAEKSMKSREKEAQNALDGDFVGAKPNPDEEPLASIIQILLETEGQKLGTEQLLNAFKKHTGEAWNSSYKATHGGFSQFVKQCSPLLSTGGKVVKLNLDELPAAQVADAKIDDHPIPSSGGDDPYPGWFQFDDSFVTPISSEKIKKQFGSKKSGENAYMLVYVRRNLYEGSTSPSLPSHVQEFIKLREDTEMEERKKEIIESNKISIFLSLLIPNSFEIERSIQVTVLKIDPISTLCQKIEAEFGISAPDQNLTLWTKDELIQVPSEISAMLLQDLGIDQGSEVIVEDMKKNGRNSSANLLLARRKKMIRLIIRDHASFGNVDSCMSFPIFVDPSASLLQLKAMALGFISPTGHQKLTECGGGRLKTLEGKILFKEKSAVSALNLKDGQSLILEAESVPSESQIHLRFQLVKNSVPFDDAIYDVVLDLSLSIEEAKTFMASVVQREAFEVRIRRCTANLKPGNIVEDESMRLVALSLKQSELVFLEMSEGQARGFVTFNVYSEIDGDVKVEAEDSSIPVCPFRYKASNFSKVGQFKLGPDSPILRIKEQVKQLPFFESAPSVHHIRVSTLGDYMQPTKVLRKNDHSLKKANFAGGTSVNILGQVLSSPSTESRRTLLRVFVRDVSTKEYLPPGGLFLDFDTSLPVTDLKRAISSLIDLKGEHMALAVYVMSKFQWKNLDGTASQKPNVNKKKKKRPTKEGLFRKLTDFSVIGVKDRRKDPKNEDNWKTDYDKYVLQLIAADASASTSTGSKKLGAELGIVINVDVESDSDDEESSGVEQDH